MVGCTASRIFGHIAYLHEFRDIRTRRQRNLNVECLPRSE